MITWNNALILVNNLEISTKGDRSPLKQLDCNTPRTKSLHEACLSYFLKCNYLQIADLQSRLLTMVEP